MDSDNDTICFDKFLRTYCKHISHYINNSCMTLEDQGEGVGSLMYFVDKKNTWGLLLVIL